MDGFPKAIRMLGMGGLCAWPALAMVDGYRIQIEFKCAGDQPKVRLNKMFERVDEHSHCLMLSGGRGVWPYALFDDGSDTGLELDMDALTMSASTWTIA